MSVAVSVEVSAFSVNDPFLTFIYLYMFLGICANVALLCLKTRVHESGHLLVAYVKERI